MMATFQLLQHATWQAQANNRNQKTSDLSTAEALRVIDDLSAASTSTLRIRVAAKPRPDLLAIAGHAIRSGMDVIIETEDIQAFDLSYLRQIKRAGVKKLAAAIDDVDPVPGNPDPECFIPPSDRDLFLDDLKEVGLLFEAQTHLTANNAPRLEKIAESLTTRQVYRWLVSVCVRQPLALPNRSVEKAISKLAKIATLAPFPIATRHAPVFVRLSQELGGIGTIEDERSGIYVDHDGTVRPDPSIDLILGNIREQPLIDLLRSHPVLRALRQPESAEGKCGVCIFENRCGGSRALAFNSQGSLFASDPACEFVVPDHDNHNQLSMSRP